MSTAKQPALLILNQMAGPMTWELAEDAGEALGYVALLTGHPDTLAKGSTERVLVCPAAPYQRGSLARRALSWIHYWLQAFFWLWRWPPNTPVLYFSNPPILCWLGWLMKTLRGQRFAVMVHDIYPDVLVRLNGFSETNPIIRIWRWQNRRAYASSQAVLTLGELMAANLERQFDSSSTSTGRVDVIYPWVNTDQIKPVSKNENWFARQHEQIDKLTVMYSGNMGLGHDIETMLDAAESLRREPHIHFMFIGAGPKWGLVKETISREGLENVTLLPWQPETNLPYQLSTADVALVSLEQELWDLAIPSKSLYSMAAGASIIAIAPSPSELATSVQDSGAGYVITPGNTGDLATTIAELSHDNARLAAFHRASRMAAVQQYSRHANSPRIVRMLIEHVCGTDSERIH